jgi:DNA-binding transcriptional MerR regulator
MIPAFEYYAVQTFTPAEEGFYNVDEAAHLAGIPRHFVAVCCKHGLVVPQIDSRYGGLLFDSDDIRTLQRIAYLHEERGVNLTGVQIILELMEEIERLKG